MAKSSPITLLREDRGGSIFHRKLQLFFTECVCRARFPDVCGYECAARHATTRLRFIYLMQNTLTVVLNGIKEWKIYRELWTRKARKEEKEREKKDYFSSAGDRKRQTGIKNSTKSEKGGFFLCVCVSLVTSGAAEPGGQTAWWAKLPWLVFLSLRSLVWLLGRILISGGSGLWPTRDAMRAFRYCRRVTCHSKRKWFVRICSTNYSLGLCCKLYGICCPHTRMICRSVRARTV